MIFVKGLKCRECGTEYPAEAIYVCENCLGPLEAFYDLAAQKNFITRAQIAAGPHSLWRYQPLLPVQRDARIDLNDGFTPLIRADRLARALGLKNLYLKNDTVNPTFSFKDRVVSVAASKALELGLPALACASTGNLAGAVAAHAARAGMPAYVFVPADLEPAKIAGAAVYGATIIAVNGNYDQANRLATEAADAYGWGFVNINLRPYYAEGSKTLAFEVAEQLGWRAPDRVIAPVASGAMFTKIWKGFQEFAELGLIEPHFPKMIGAQAEGCAPVATAWTEGTREVRAVKPRSIAKSLAIGSPADGRYVIDVARESHGAVVSVREESVAEGIELLARTEGIFGETAAGVTIAALQKIAREIDPNETVVAYITGNGLKTIDVIAARVNVVNVEPMFESLQEKLQGESIRIPALASL
jgi:threonine synthase